MYIYIDVYLPTISCNIFWYRDKRETLPPKHWPATWHFCQLPVKQHPNADPQHRIVPQRLRTTHGIGTIPVCSLVFAPPRSKWQNTNRSMTEWRCSCDKTSWQMVIMSYHAFHLIRSGTVQILAWHKRIHARTYQTRYPPHRMPGRFMKTTLENYGKLQ